MNGTCAGGLDFRLDTVGFLFKFMLELVIDIFMDNILYLLLVVVIIIHIQQTHENPKSNEAQLPHLNLRLMLTHI